MITGLVILSPIPELSVGLFLDWLELVSPGAYMYVYVCVRERGCVCGFFFFPFLVRQA